MCSKNDDDLFSKKARLDCDQKAFTKYSNGFSILFLKCEVRKKNVYKKKGIKDEQIQTLHHNRSAISVIFLQLNKTIQTSSATNIM